ISLCYSSLLLSLLSSLSSFFFFIDPSTTHIYTLSLHDALPISAKYVFDNMLFVMKNVLFFLYNLKPNRSKHLHQILYFLFSFPRSEEHTSELQSRFDLVCRLLLEKKNKL